MIRKLLCIIATFLVKRIHNQERMNIMSIKHRVIVSTCVIVLSSCGLTTRTEITKVAIHINPSDGQAHCEFTADGWAEGGHTSGGPEPFVHMEREEVPQEQINAIWEAASALDTSVYILETSAGRECVECVDLFIYYEDGRVMHLSWPFGEQHPDPKVQELEALMYEYNVGGW